MLEKSVAEFWLSVRSYQLVLGLFYGQVFGQRLNLLLHKS